MFVWHHNTINYVKQQKDHNTLFKRLQQLITVGMFLVSGEYFCGKQMPLRMHSSVYRGLLACCATYHYLLTLYYTVLFSKKHLYTVVTIRIWKKPAISKIEKMKYTVQNLTSQFFKRFMAKHLVLDYMERRLNEWSRMRETQRKLCLCCITEGRMIKKTELVINEELSFLLTCLLHICTFTQPWSHIPMDN